MKQGILIAIISIVIFSCNNSANNADKMRADSLQDQLNKQHLIDSLKNDIQNQKQTQSPSTINNTEQPGVDTVVAANFSNTINEEEYVGKWNIKMKAFQSDCKGTDLGDTKTEVWTINIKGENYIVTVSENDNATNNSYSGNVINGTLVLTATYNSLFTAAKTSAEITLTSTKNFTGTRKLLRGDPCEINYTINGSKQ